MFDTHGPEVADFPRGRVKQRGGDKQAGEAAAVEPGGDAMPLVNRQEVEHGAAHHTGENPELSTTRRR